MLLVGSAGELVVGVISLFDIVSSNDVDDDDGVIAVSIFLSLKNVIIENVAITTKKLIYMYIYQ